jgi:hypothetical protein
LLSQSSDGRRGLHNVRTDEFDISLEALAGGVSFFVTLAMIVQ